MKSLRNLLAISSMALITSPIYATIPKDPVQINPLEAPGGCEPSLDYTFICFKDGNCLWDINLDYRVDIMTTGSSNSVVAYAEDLESEVKSFPKVSIHNNSLFFSKEARDELSGFYRSYFYP